jgi:Mu transposase, C-terminal domain
LRTPDYHIEIASHYYSVPSRLIREVVEARITSTTVEIFPAGLHRRQLRKTNDGRARHKTPP